MKSVKIALDCGSMAEPTISTIDQVARLQLEARRCGCKLELRDANPYLLGLISFAGLGGVLGVFTYDFISRGRAIAGSPELGGISESAVEHHV